jgi:uncharacterized SAM-binding protein YcdF (DUF218 family)
MFYVLSKVTGYFLVPSNVIAVFLLVGTGLMFTRFAHVGRRALIAGAVLFAAIGFLPVGAVLTLPLEERFPAWDATRGAPDGIVVLGGAIDAELSAARSEFALSDAAERITATVGLARRYPAARIVFAGGGGGIISQSLAEAYVAVRLFESLGLPAARVEFEAKSRNTAENALFAKQLVAPKVGERWLLVTSALHMPRAVGAFRAVGFPVEAHPVDWRTEGPRALMSISGSAVDGLLVTDAAIHEWVGLLAYWITGRTSELLPGPK